MRKSLWMIVLLLALSGCQSRIDIGPYLSIGVADPKFNDNLEVTDIEYKVEFDQDKMGADYPDIDLNSNDGFEQLKFVVDGIPLAEYNDDIVEVKIELDENSKQLLKDNGFTYQHKLTLDPASDQFASLQADYQQKASNLESKVDEVKDLEFYANVAKELKPLFDEQGLEFYVTKDKFEAGYDYYGLDIPIYDGVDEINQLIVDNDIYFIVSRTTEVDGEERTYTKFYDGNFFEFEMFEFNGRLTTAYAHGNATQEYQNVVNSTVYVPMKYVFQTNVDSRPGKLLIEETGTWFTGFDTMDNVIDDYATVFESTVEKPEGDKWWSPEQLAPIISETYSTFDDLGREREFQITSPAENVTVLEWIISQFAVKSVEDYSEKDFTAQVSDVLFTQYDLYGKMAEHLENE